jgi:ribulose kinase
MYSSCVLQQVCKWNYDALGTADGNGGKPGWDAGFLASIGLSELLNDAPNNPIGSVVSPPGEPVGKGLQLSASEDLGLPVGTPVGVSMIDAHAGGLGVLGALVPPVPGTAAAAIDASDSTAATTESSSVSDAEMASRLALIAGTSCCHMLSSKEPVFVPGVWGPYASAMVPGLALNEGGQSAAGKLLDFVTSTHAAYPELLERAKQVFTLSLPSTYPFPI